MLPTPTTRHSRATITNTVKLFARDLLSLNHELYIIPPLRWHQNAVLGRSALTIVTKRSKCCQPKSWFWSKYIYKNQKSLRVPMYKGNVPAAVPTLL